jgi:hypothetical protein
MYDCGPLGWLSFPLLYITNKSGPNYRALTEFSIRMLCGFGTLPLSIGAFIVEHIFPEIIFQKEGCMFYELYEEIVIMVDLIISEYNVFM